jgi:hypothetical protein
MKQIEVEQGNEFRIYGRRIVENDIFLNAYEQAAAILEDIVTASEKENSSSLQDTYMPPPDFLNNIIAFTGERGQGKSSAMAAFTNTLTDGICSSAIIKFSNHTKAHTFIKLNKIDPTTFDSTNNLLEVVVARLFNSFETLYKNNKSKINADSKNEIMQLFEKAYESICLGRNAKLLGNLEMDYETNIQKLAYVSNGTSLQTTICKLIQKYLELYRKIHESDRIPYLIVPIDDLDINIEYAYKMAEQIRKYLIIPNVVIIMAINIEQLKLCARNQFYENLSSMKTDKNEKELDARAANMAAKYIDKLIPDGRKIGLPIISTFEESGRDAISLIYNNSQGENLLRKYKGKGLQDTLLGFIFDRTKIVFVPRKKSFGVHPIIPSTLRELVNLLSVLGKMTSLPEKKEGSYKDILLQNLHVFENFFINTWCTNNLDYGNMEIIQKINRESPLNMHRYVISKLMDIIEKTDIYTTDKKSPLLPSEYALTTLKDRISHKKADPLLNNLGDVMLLLDILSYRYVSHQIQSLAFAIKVIYTITLKRILLTQDEHSSQERPSDPSTFHKFLGSSLWSETTVGLLRDNRDVFEFIPSVTLFGDESENRKKASSIKEDEYSKVLQLAYLCDFPVESSRVPIPEYSRSLYPGNSSIVKEARFNLSNLLISAVDYEYLPYKTGLNYSADYKKYLEMFKNGIDEDSLLLILSNYELIELIQTDFSLYNRAAKEGMTEGEYLNDFIHFLNKLLHNISYFSENEKSKVLIENLFQQSLVKIFADSRENINEARDNKSKSLERSVVRILAEDDWDNLEPKFRKRYNTAKNTVSRTIDNPRENPPSGQAEIGEVCSAPYFQKSVLNLAYILAHYGNRQDSPVPFDDELKNTVRDLYAKSAVIISRDGRGAKITESMWIAFNECVNKINSNIG